MTPFLCGKLTNQFIMLDPPWASLSMMLRMILSEGKRDLKISNK